MFRCLALLFPLLLLAIIEAGLRIAGVGYPPQFFIKTAPGGKEPWCKYLSWPAWIENGRFGWRFFPAVLARTPEPLLVRQQKPARTCRILVFGESAALGDPAPDYGFSRILEVMLRAQYPGADFEVVNLGMTAISSPVILEIARESGRLRADVWVVYMGNNEVVGPYGAGTVFTAQAPGLAFIRASIALRATRLGQCLDRLRQRANRTREWEGMEMFLRQQVRHDDPRMNVVYGNFRRNLEDLLRLGTAAGAPVLLSTVVANLKDCPPFASLPRRGLGAADRARWLGLFDAASKLLAEEKPAEALAGFQAAARVDNEPAELHYRLGQCLLRLNKPAEARQSFNRALDLDTLRFRADTRIHEIIRETARGRAGVTLLDAAEVFARQSPQNLAGDEYLFEHVHLNFEGNWLLACNVAEQLRPLLPPWVRQAAGATAAPLPLEECARQLGLTDWNRLQIAEEVEKRLQQAPFTNQLGHVERERRWRETVAKLREAETHAGLERAVATAREAAKRRPTDWRLRGNLARLLEAAGNNQEAFAEWEAVHQLLPHEPEALFHLGNLSTAGRGLEIADYFREALRLKPDAVEVLNGLGLVLAAQGKTAEAIGQFEKALRIKPGFVEARANLGQTLAGVGRIEEARAQYETALRQDTNCVAAHINLGKLCSVQGNKAEALRHYQEALRIKPDQPVAHYNLANTLADLGRHDEAVRHYAAAVQVQPDFAEARENLGLELARQERASEALEQLTEAARLRPDWAEARLNLGVALARARRFDEAAAQFREVLRLQPGHPDAAKYLEKLR